MKKTRKPEKPIAAEAIARLAERGKDVSSYFTNRGRMMVPLSGPIRRVNVDFTAGMPQELDSAAGQLNISRLPVIKTLLRQALYQHLSGGGCPAESRLRTDGTIQSAIENRPRRQSPIANHSITRCLDIAAARRYVGDRAASGGGDATTRVARFA